MPTDYDSYILCLIHGRYQSPLVATQYGASVRTQNIFNLLINKLNPQIILDIGISRSTLKIRENHINNQEIVFINIPLRISSLLLRTLYKIFKYIRPKSLIYSAYDPATISVKNHTNILKKYLQNKLIAVVDGPLGITLYTSIVKGFPKEHKLIYLSHDALEDKYHGFWLRILKDREKEVIKHASLILVSSIRDKFKFIDKYKNIDEKIIVFPNIYPPKYDDLSDVEKYDVMTIVIVGNWLLASDKYFTKLLHKLYEFTKNKFKLIYINKHPKIPMPKHVEYYQYIKNRKEYLKTLAKAHIGINYALQSGGSNVKKYDYALAGLTIMSGGTGFRGEYLPGEITFLDYHDLIGKLSMISIDEAIRLGKINLRTARTLHEKATRDLTNTLINIL